MVADLESQLAEAREQLDGLSHFTDPSGESHDLTNAEYVLWLVGRSARIERLEEALNMTLGAIVTPQAFDTEVVIQRARAALSAAPERAGMQWSGCARRR